jgi:hypothetical protein
MSRFRGLPPYRVLRSAIHGSGVFATRPISAGTRLLEYRGERISHAEADRRHAAKDVADHHTFLFSVDARTMIDGGVGGNAARFINHGCEPNCEARIERGRVFIEACAVIRAGEELLYDYRLERDADDSSEADRIYGCRCGEWRCRGSLLLPSRPALRRALDAALSA